MKTARMICWFVVALGATGTPAQAWDLVLADSVLVAGPEVRLAEIVRGEVPPRVGMLNVAGGMRPGGTAVVQRRTLLRRLVTAGLAAGARLKGAEVCRISCGGKSVSAGDLEDGIRKALAHLVPAPRPGAPESWLELTIPPAEVGAAGRIALRNPRSAPLEPGRTQLMIRAGQGKRATDFPVVVTLHAYAETATARTGIGRGQALEEKYFRWEWRDLVGLRGDLAQNRDSIVGQSAARSLAAGDALRNPDLKSTPLIRMGDAVELLVMRGPVTATTRAFARQAGCLGQTIPVRNELTGRLVNARVTGPGVVEWRH